MNILFFHNTIASYRLPFFQQLSKMVNLKICLTNSDLAQKIYGNTVELKDEEFEVVYLPKRNIAKYISNIITEKKYDVCILPTLDSFRDAFVSHCICKSRRKDMKLGFFWEKWEPDKKKQPFMKQMKNLLQKKVAKIILKNVDVVWYPGIKTKEYFLSMGISKQCLFKIHDSSMMYLNEEKMSYQPDNRIKVLYFGRIIERKGLRVLIEALNKIKDEDIVLTIAGDGEQINEFKELVNKYHIPNVTFVGYVNPSDRAKYFFNTDIFVLPSIIENGVIEAWGLTVNEAVQCKKFVIASNAVGSAFELITEENGMIVNENNLEDLAKALLVAKKVCRNQEVETASEKLLEEYNYINMAKDILKPFKKNR